MNKYNETFGIDISKDVFDCYGSKQGRLQFNNSELGFKKFHKTLSKNSLVVMEATGYYHYRFIQMKLAKVKTDKSDAKAICNYGLTQDVPLYNALTDTQSECLQLFRLMDNLLKTRTATKNKIHGEQVLGVPSPYVFRSLKRTKKYLDKELKGIEQKLLSLVKEDQQEQLTLLQSIPGVGMKTALFLIIVTDGFNKFETASQLCSYVGITPTIRESGSSVRGRARISKVGNRKLRNLLFLCSMSAYKHNKSCMEIFERITNKGKSKKLALIAVSNKLLKQCFAIAKSGRPYDPTFVSVLVSK